MFTRPTVMEQKGFPLYEKLKRARAQLPYIPDTFWLIWAASRRWTVAWACLLFLQGVLPVALVFVSGALADSLGSAVRSSDWSHNSQLLLWAGAIVSILLGMQSLNSLLGWVRGLQAELVQDHISDRIHAKAIELDLSFYDSPEYYDRLYRARIDAYDRPVALLENVGSLLQNALTFVAMAVILLRFGAWLPVVLFVGMLPVLFVITRYTLREVSWLNQSTEARRRASYFDWMLTERESAAEMRLFSLGDLFRGSYQGIRARLRAERAALSRGQALAEVAAGTLALLSMGLVMLWMLRRLVAGQASLGEAAILYQAFSQGQRLIQTLLGSAGQVFRNVLFIENLFEFLKLKPKQEALPNERHLGKTLQSGICFEQVSFRYPGSEQTVLQDFDLTIPAGQIAAFVGENGAGKSTLMKLICRFYDPDCGRITMVGIDLREIQPAELWRSVSVLFQEPVRYYENAGQNIAFGELAAHPSKGRVMEAARAAGAHELIMKLPEAYETMLGKWFGGAELSTGEWQRVALARAFLRQAPVLILDEPTSAMDSWAEADWMSRFRALADGRTAILVTHRFTTAMQADVIHVMSGGRVIESGTHVELLASNGKYAQSWRQQMRMAEVDVFMST
jgi:ATP-binding cassette subfamily B protein